MSRRTYSVSIVGESNYQDSISKKLIGERAFFEPEPDNPHDPRAIRVENHRGETIGYIARDSWLTSALLDEGKQIIATIESVGRERRSGNLGVVLEVTVSGEGRAVGAVQPEFASKAEAAVFLVKRSLETGAGCLALVIIAALIVGAIAELL